MKRRTILPALLLLTVAACGSQEPVASLSKDQHTITPIAPTTAPPTTTAPPVVAPKGAPEETPKAKPRPSTSAAPKAPTAAPQRAAGCDWQREFERGKAGLPGTWQIGEPQGAWGTTYPNTGRVYISPRTPCDKVYSVARHEGCHVRQGQIYGSLQAAEAALASYGGVEVNADACARQIGATWFNYRPHPSSREALGGLATARGVRAPNV